MSKPMSKTEIKTRLQSVGAEIKRLESMGTTPTRLEVGWRTHPQWRSEPPVGDDARLASDYSRALPEGDFDDLLDFSDIGDAAKQLAAEAKAGSRGGAILHLYLSERSGSPRYGYDWELVDVYVVWLGTETEQPRVIDHHMNYGEGI